MRALSDSYATMVIMSTSVRPPDPPLRTSQFALRLFRAGDVDAVVAAGRDPQITGHTFMPRDPNQAKAIAWIDRAISAWELGACRLAINAVDDPTERCIGQVGIVLREIPGNAEAVYWLLDEARGSGWAAQALELVTRWAFEDLGIERVEVLVDLDNEASLKTAEIAGFTREGIRRGYEQVPDRGRVDLWCLSRLSTD